MEEEILDVDSISEEELFSGKKLYSNRVILTATFIGGPAAAGFLIRENFRVLGKEKQGNKAFVLGIVSTVLLFGGLFLIPESVIDKIPNMVIPLVYMGIIYLIVEKIQGKELKRHEENKGEFYSGWRAAGIGAISGVVLGIGIFTFALYGPGSWDADSYNAGLEKFNENEAVAMEVFDILETKTPQEIATFIEEIGIPAWEENVNLIESMDTISGLPEEFIKQNKLLHEYSEIRVKSYQLIEEAILTETSEYDDEIYKLHERIDEIINSL